MRLRCGAWSDGGVRLEVEDEGRGDPSGATRSSIFERFQQLETGEERRGTGLGLTISRQIVEHHGGRIWAEPGRTKRRSVRGRAAGRTGGEARDGSV